MEDNQINPETETGAMALGDSEILAEIEEIGRLSEEINQSLTEVQWRQQLDAPASTTERTEKGADMGFGQ